MSKLNDNDIFNNPMVRAAENAMTAEQKEQFAKIGENLYGTTDFVKNTVLDNMPDPMVDSLLHITVQLRSGLHPVDLNEDEIKLLTEVHGEKWYEKWGYTEQDLKSY